MLKQVFISYRHESPEHARNVRRLAKLLRQAGLPVALDQFYLDENPGGPELGWPKWCEDCAIESACVLIIASLGWFATYNKSEDPGGGLGAATESDVFRQALYDNKGRNTNIRLAFLHTVDINSVPARLRAWHSFRPFEDDHQLDQLIAWAAKLLDLKNIETPTVRWPVPAAFSPDLANRSQLEWPAVVDLLAGRSRERILLYDGESGLGKSVLIRQAVLYACELDIPVAQVNFKGGVLDIPAILGQFLLDVGEYLPNFTRQGGDKSHLLRRDLRGLRHPILVIFDSYELIAENKPIVDWLCQQFLPEVETALGLAVIVAGQQVPDHTRAIWQNLARRLPLKPITEVKHWEPWVAKRYPDFPLHGEQLKTLVKAARGQPSVIETLCAGYVSSEMNPS